MLDVDEKFSSKLENLITTVENQRPSQKNLTFSLKKEPTKDKTREDLNDFISKSQKSIITDIFEKNLEFRRWLILISYVTLNFMNGFAWGTYSPIMEEAETYYSATSLQVCWFIYQFYIIFIFFSLPGSYVLGKSLSFSLKIGGFVNCLGAWLRYAAFKNYPFALFGQCLIALSSNVIMNSPNNVANAWFHAKERFFAVTVGVFSNTFGTGVGYLVSPLIVVENSENISELNFISAILLTIPFVMCLIIVKEKPKNPPNLATTIPRANFKLSLKILIRNKKYLISVLSFGICFSNCWSILSVIDLFLEKQDLPSFLVGLLGLLLIVAGLVTSFIGTLFLRYAAESRKYFDPITKILFGITMISLLLISIIIPMRQYLPVLIFGLIILGVGSLGLQPFECEALEEISYPAQESIAISGMFFVSSSFGFPLSIISTLEVFGDFGIWVFAISMLPFTIYILIVYKTDFKKSNKEGHFSSFNEKIPLPFEEEADADEKTSIDFVQNENEPSSP